MAGGYRDYWEKSRNTLAIFRGYWGERYRTAVGLLYDSFVQILVDAARSARLAEPDGPAYDALRPLGIERSIKQWPEENWSQYRSRLATPWDTWSRTGFSRILDQLELAGFPGAFILRTGLTEFDVIFPVGTHTVGPAPTWGGGFIYGDGTRYGPTGITPTQLETVRGIIKQWKAHNWVCRKVTWVLSGWVYGDPSIHYGDPGLVWGGATVSVGVY